MANIVQCTLYTTTTTTTLSAIDPSDMVLTKHPPPLPSLSPLYPYLFFISSRLDASTQLSLTCSVHVLRCPSSQLFVPMSSPPLSLVTVVVIFTQL